MKKFKFTLNSVHKVREITKERESVLLGELRSEADRAALRISHIESMRQEAIKKYTSRIANGERLDAMEMELSSKHFASLDRLQREAEKALVQKQHACDLQVVAVAEAMREVKITENIRETQRVRHQTEFEKQEQNNVDEMVTTGFARRLMGEK